MNVLPLYICMYPIDLLMVMGVVNTMLYIGEEFQALNYVYSV